MNKAIKTKNVIQIILYTILLGVSLFSLLYKPIGGEITEILKNVAMYFTALTNAVIALASIVGIIHCVRVLASNKRFISGPTYTFKLCTALMAIVSFLLFITYLHWQETDYMAYFKDDMLKNIAFHYVTPLLSLFLFIFFDNDDKVSPVHCLWGFIPIGVYLAYVIPVANLGLDGRGETFNFFKFTLAQWYKGLIVVVGLLLAAIIFSFALWLLNRIAYLIFVGDTESVEITKEEKQELGKTVTVTKEDEKTVDEEFSLIEEKSEEPDLTPEEIKGAALKYNGAVRVYHISRQSKSGLWQVKIANSKKAVKLFSTQAEAIFFAKQLVLSRGGSIRVHAVSGRIRKA